MVEVNVEKVLGYKVFNSNWKCRNFLFEVGKTYQIEGKLEICKNGFHFCSKLLNCFNYYSFDPSNKVALIEAKNIITKGDKSCTDIITIVKELTWPEVLNLVNTGDNNTGYSNIGNNNTGSYNTGDRNTGNRNTGDRNTGDNNTGSYNTGYSNIGNNNTGSYNTGSYNTGDRNTGNRNTGNRNTGDRNTGDNNTGYRNTGDFNSGNYSSGLFNSEINPKIKIFDIESNLTIQDYLNSKVKSILDNFSFTTWIYFSDMNDKEKNDNKYADLQNGYLKITDYKIAFKSFWKKLSNCDKKEIISLPNFDKDKFYTITGVKITSKLLKEIQAP